MAARYLAILQHSKHNLTYYVLPGSAATPWVSRFSAITLNATY